MICHERRVIFIHIQKTAGNSIATAFGHNVNPPEKHWTAGQIKNICGDDAWHNYYKFSIVRNPWDRLVSWWAMIDARRPALDRGGKLNAFTRYILTHAQTFEEFLLNATDEIVDTDGVKSITRNQLDYIADSNGNFMVDYVGRFETLQKDFGLISEKVFGERRVLPHVNNSIRSDYRRYYTPDLANLVASRFFKDIKEFGYNFDPPSGLG